MVAEEGILAKVVNALLSYETIKIVTIRNKKVGFLHRIIQLAILGYVIGYVIRKKTRYKFYLFSFLLVVFISSLSVR